MKKLLILVLAVVVMGMAGMKAEAVEAAVIWPSVFDTKDVSSIPCEAFAVATALEGMAICMSGQKPHKNFGEVMAAIYSKYPNMPARFQDLMKYSENINTGDCK